jgi:hypothetical protein
MEKEFIDFIGSKFQVNLDKIHEIKEEKLRLIEKELSQSIVLFHEFYFVKNNLGFKIRKLRNKEIENFEISKYRFGENFLYIENIGFVLGEEDVLVPTESSTYHGTYKEVSDGTWKKLNLLFTQVCSFRFSSESDFIKIDCSLIDSLEYLFRNYDKTKRRWDKFINSYSQKIKDHIKGIKNEKFNTSKINYLQEIPTDENGNVHLVDNNDFENIFHKNQNFILSKNESYIQKFVKISIYLRTKRRNIETIFQSIKSVNEQNSLDQLIKLLKNQIHSYEQLIFHSLTMVTSLIENDLITFYEVYECFDKLGVFDSNWENEISKKLTSINNSVRDLMVSINEMESSIVRSLTELTYINRTGFTELTSKIDYQLKDINSSLTINNLLTGIQTYQMYRINQNTKRLN